jgi:hypothetical protein
MSNSSIAELTQECTCQTFYVDELRSLGVQNNGHIDAQIAVIEKKLKHSKPSYSGEGKPILSMCLVLKTSLTQARTMETINLFGGDKKKKSLNGKSANFGSLSLFFTLFARKSSLFRFGFNIVAGRFFFL